MDIPNIGISNFTTRPDSEQPLSILCAAIRWMVCRGILNNARQLTPKKSLFYKKVREFGPVVALFAIGLFSELMNSTYGFYLEPECSALFPA
jgi:hypothetical protein